MQCFQLSRRLPLFGQFRMGEEAANVMGYSAEQVAIVHSIRFTTKLIAQHHERREPSLRTNRETECRCRGHKGIFSEASTRDFSRPVVFDQDRLILFQKLLDHRMGKLQWSRLLLSSHRTGLAKTTI